MWNYVAAVNATHLLLVPCLLYVALKELVLQEGKQRFGLISLQTHTHTALHDMLCHGLSSTCGLTDLVHGEVQLHQ